MPTAQVNELEAVTVTETVSVRAAARDVFALITDVRRWPQLLTPLIHTRVEAGEGGATDVVRCWGVRGHDAIRAWSARRWIDEGAMRVEFDNTPAPPGASDQRGLWAVVAHGDRACTVTLRHTFRPSDGAGAQVRERLMAEFGRHSRAQLMELSTAAERGGELEELIVSWEDTLLTSGDQDAAWAVLYEADRWPERIPHVSRIDMTEPEPGVQFFDMDTTTPDGRAHTTRSVRVCFGQELIVYKQTTLPPTLEAHTGHWRFTRTPAGLEMGARHTVTLKRSALSQLGPDMTVEAARAYARRVLGTNSMKNLVIAKDYAEGRASD